MIREYDPLEDAAACYWFAISQLRKRHVAAQGDYWQTLGELYAWEAGPLFGFRQYPDNRKGTL